MHCSKNWMKILLPTMALAIGLTFMTAPGHAAPASCAVTGKGKSGATFSLTDATQSYCSTKNDKISNTDTLFGLTGWSLSDKNDDATAGTGKITFATAPANGSKAGSWTLDTLAGLSTIVITLKAGDGFAAFLLDLTGTTPLTGTWEASKDLSHASIYYTGSPLSVPLPATALLLVSGVAGIGLLARRTAPATVNRRA